MNIPPLSQAVILAIAGVAIGSFLNVVIHRGPAMWRLIDDDKRGNLIGPGSYCPSCKAPIEAFRLVPIISFVAQRGRCAVCASPISPRYPLVEAFGGVVALLAVCSFGVTWSALAVALFGFALIALAFIDLETGYLPDAITLPLIAGGLIANASIEMVPIGDALIGAVAGYASLQGVAILYKALRGRDGLGEGDAKLLAAIGAFGGWAILPAVVFVGAAATLMIVALRRTASLDQPIPFGPGLCAAAFAVIIAARLFFSAP